jgi:GT2 family glycosyltransferase
MQLAIDELQQGNAVQARRWLAKAMVMSANSEPVTALLAATLAKDESRVGLSVLQHAIAQFPDSSMLWPLYWRVMTASVRYDNAQPASAEEVKHVCKQVYKQVHARLPWLTPASGVELEAIVQLLVTLSAVTSAVTSEPTPHRLGFVRFDAATKCIRGWAIDLSQVKAQTPLTACALFIRAKTERGQQIEGKLMADAPDRLLTAAGLSREVGGFTIQLPDYCSSVELLFEDDQSLVGSPLVAVRPITVKPMTPGPMAVVSDAFVSKANSQTEDGIEASASSLEGGSSSDTSDHQVTEFVVLSDEDSIDLNGQESLEPCETGSPTIGDEDASQDLLQGTAQGTEAQLAPAVNVLIPIFEGREHALACLRSVIAAQAHNTTPHHIIVLDDASQDEQLIAALQALAQKKQIMLVRRAANLSFIRNMNRGMAMRGTATTATTATTSTTSQNDVVWLNADTRVSGNWLDRLKAVADKDPCIASVTPWSNNGEAMSLAGFHQPSETPTEAEHQVIDNLVNTLNLPAQTLVSGCGFCFYVKRQAINDVGYLDETTLIDGYGEETDWCLRARALGWQHMGATNVFVSHAGGQSFGARKQLLAKHNNKIIRERYPLADRIHDHFRENDPLQPLRETIAAKLKSEGIFLRPTAASKADAASGVLSGVVSGAVSGAVSGVASPLAPTAGLPADVVDGSFMARLSKVLLSVGEHKAPSKKQASKLNAHSEADFGSHTHTGVIVDDLKSPDVLNAWLAYARQVQQKVEQKQTQREQQKAVPKEQQENERSEENTEVPQFTLPRLLILQDAPGSLLLEKTGIATRIGCPAGLSWAQWLDLLGVTHQVSLVVDSHSLADTAVDTEVGTYVDTEVDIEVEPLADTEATPRPKSKMRSNTRSSATRKRKSDSSMLEAVA